MKYFDRELYEKMGLMGVLSFETDIDKLNTLKEMLKKYNVDYDEINKKKFEESLPLLTKYVPQNIIDKIYKEIIVDKSIASEELFLFGKEWRQTFEKEFEQRRYEYNQHYKSLETLFSEDAKDLHVKGLHDAKIISLYRPEEGGIEIKLDCRGAIGISGICLLTFNGVKSFETQGDILNDFCIWDEIYVDNAGVYEFHVLLTGSEFKVVADRITLNKVD